MGLATLAAPADPPRATAKRMTAARAAQAEWAARSITNRLRLVRRFRSLLATRGAEICRAARVGAGRDRAEILTSEVLPLAEAARFLESSAEDILAPSRPRSPRPAVWLAGTEVEVHRRALGLILIVGPSNYPLFLPAVQTLQALVAGNAVWIKPGAGGRDAAQSFAGLLGSAGLPPDLCTVLGEDPSEAEAAIDLDVDKILLTGSSDTGRAVLRRAAARLTPATVELSGCDPVFVLPGADLERTTRALTFGVTLNGGATCIAPRRVYAEPSEAAELVRRTKAAFSAAEPVELDPAIAARSRAAVARALAAGARLESGSPDQNPAPPILLSTDRPDLDLFDEDLFAPILTIVAIPDLEQAPALAARSPYALGASVFGPEGPARSLAQRARAGVVTVNDLIVPTADPRVPFGGAGESGFGTTRGAEGLLDLTRPLAVATRRARRLRHLEPQPEDSPRLFLAYLKLVHAQGWRHRVDAFADLIRTVSGTMRSRRRN